MSCPTDRFILKTKKAATGCILWTGGRLRGYGSFNIDGKTISAHRAAYQLFRGPIPKGLFVLHDCPSGDNRLCVNPAHLWLGSGQDNMDDMVQKGRQAKQLGSRHGKSKITEADVLAIRMRCASGERQKTVAADYDLDPSQVSNIINLKNWRHI